MPARYGDLANGEMPEQIYGVSWNGDEKVNYTYKTGDGSMSCDND